MNLQRERVRERRESVSPYLRVSACVSELKHRDEFTEEDDVKPGTEFTVLYR